MQQRISVKTRNARGCARDAFTLIELLVVIAIIALLISILLPSLAAAREAGRSLVCSSTLRSMGQGQMQYSLDSHEYFASINTSNADAFYHATYESGANLCGDTSATSPVSIWDWISPSMGNAMHLPTNRAKRALAIFNTWGCASVRRLIKEVYYDVNPPDRNDFEAAQREAPYRQSSYLQPSGFVGIRQTVDRPTAITFYGPRGKAPKKRYIAFDDPATVPESYEPRMDKIGINLSRKILAVDGTRYYESSSVGGKLDFDASLTGIYSSFSDSMPIYNESTAYGRSSPHVLTGDTGHIKLSYRHTGMLNAVMFDGSVQRISKDESYRNVSLWYPSGSIFTGGIATPESKAAYTVGKPIP